MIGATSAVGRLIFAEPRRAWFLISYCRGRVVFDTARVLKCREVMFAKWAS